MPVWLKEKLFQKTLLKKELKELRRRVHDFDWTSGCLFFAEHHLSHAASAFFALALRARAVVLTMDGVGEWATTSAGRSVDGNRLEIVKRDPPSRTRSACSIPPSPTTPASRSTSGEYKVMGLAPYGEPRFADLILDKLIDLKEDGSFRLDLSTISTIAPG